MCNKACSDLEPCAYGRCSDLVSSAACWFWWIGCISQLNLHAPLPLPPPPCREQKVDVTIHTLKDGVVRVEDAESSLYASIDVVCDKVRYIQPLFCASVRVPAPILAACKLAESTTNPFVNQSHHPIPPPSKPPTPHPTPQVSRKLRKIKERAITKGTWSGRAGPRVDTEEQEFKVWPTWNLIHMERTYIAYGVE